ncbi:MAG TPA: efflux transporter outer membrane subunit [Myxococcota bacterium]|nr:efflux transporter outer membrane subunit [Myxococcota bacterium]
MFRPPSLCLVLLLAGCAVGPDWLRPEPASPAGYTREPTPERLAPAAGEPEQQLALARDISARWYQAFGSADLDAVIERALQDSPDLAAARATLAQAHESVTAARGAFYPQVDANAGVSRTGTPGLGTGVLPVTGRTFSLYSVGATASYAVDVFGGIRRSIEEQQSLAELQYYELAAAWLSITGSAVSDAVSIASLRAQIEASQDVIEDDRNNLSLVERKYQAGKAARSDVLVAQTQLEGDLALLPALRQQLAIAEHALSVLAGQLPGTWSPPEFALAGFAVPGELPLSVPSELARQRPDILAAESQLHAASAAIGVATANLYPSLVLSADITREAVISGGAGTAWSIAAQLAQPLFHGGTLRAERRGAVDAYQATLARYQQTVLGGFEQIADTLRALGHDADLVGAQAELLDTASESLRLQRISYDAGKSDLLLLLSAQRAYQQARLDLARAQGQRLQDTAELFVALGGGWWNAGL